jgi:predicted aldo/keto reductase-like oxidoreductase
MMNFLGIGDASKIALVFLEGVRDGDRLLLFGDFVDLKGAEAVVHYALAQGINYFGTADSYGIGLSDEKLGAMQAAKAR